MSLENARRTIESHFKTGWVNSQGNELTPIAFDNVKFKPPSNNEWVGCTIVHGLSSQISLGNSPIVRSVGVVIIQIFTDAGSGSSRALQLADKAGDIFRARRLTISANESILFREPNFVRFGVTDNIFSGNLNVDFWRDEIINS